MFFHPFDKEDSVHQTVQQIKTMELPDVSYNEGGDNTTKNLKDANEYLENNFLDQRLIHFPPKPVNKKQPSTDMDRMITMFESTFKRIESDRRRIIIPISQKVNKELLNSHGFCFDGNDNLIVFDGQLNIIILISFAKEDFWNDLQVLHTNMKAFVKVCADIFNNVASKGDPVAIIGFMYHSTYDKKVMLDPFEMLNKEGYYCGTDQISKDENQDDFDQWYNTVSFYFSFKSY